MQSTFVRESIGFNPLRSQRDWLVLATVLAVLAAVTTLLAPDQTSPFCVVP